MTKIYQKNQNLIIIWIKMSKNEDKVCAVLYQKH